MGKKVYTSAVRLLRDLTDIDFFGWADDELMVDAVAYISTKDIEKLDILPVHIRNKVLLTVGPTDIRICLPKINFAPMNSDLGALQETMPSIRSKKLERIERRSFRIATLSMATGSFRSLSPRTLKEQGELFHEHIESIHHLLMEKNPFQPDEIAVCVLPEFYSHCLHEGKSQLFMPYHCQTQLLETYCSVSKKFDEILIMVNITALTESAVNDDHNAREGFKPKNQKTNMLLGLKGGQVVFVSFKVNKGPTDIPDIELKTSESERNTYYQAKVDEQLMPLSYMQQFKGVTFSGSVCIDAEEGTIGKYLKGKFPEFNVDEHGPSLQFICSSSLSLPLFKQRHEILENQLSIPKKGQGLIIQADGHDKLKRSGVWLVDGADITRLVATSSKALKNNVTIDAFHVSVDLLNNKLHDALEEPMFKASTSMSSCGLP